MYTPKMYEFHEYSRQRVLCCRHTVKRVADVLIYKYSDHRLVPGIAIKLDWLPTSKPLIVERGARQF